MHWEVSSIKTIYRWTPSICFRQSILITLKSCQIALAVAIGTLDHGELSFIGEVPLPFLSVFGICIVSIEEKVLLLFDLVFFPTHICLI